MQAKSDFVAKQILTVGTGTPVDRGDRVNVKTVEYVRRSGWKDPNMIYR